MKDYYSVLGLEKDASLEEIKEAYKKYAAKFHPDKHGNDEFFKEQFLKIREAYEYLIKNYNQPEPEIIKNEFHFSEVVVIDKNTIKKKNTQTYENNIVENKETTSKEKKSLNRAFVGFWALLACFFVFGIEIHLIIGLTFEETDWYIQNKTLISRILMLYIPIGAFIIGFIERKICDFLFPVMMTLGLSILSGVAVLIFAFLFFLIIVGDENKSQFFEVAFLVFIIATIISFILLFKRFKK